MLHEHGDRWHRDVFKPYSWFCVICNNHEDNFTNSQSVFDHMQVEHPDIFSIVQLRTISRHSKTQVARPKGVCLLCSSPIDLGQLRDRKGLSSSKTHKETLQTSSKSARLSKEMRSPGPHITDYNATTDSDPPPESYEGMETLIGHEALMKYIAGHIAKHLKMLMLLTMRLANLQEMEEDSIDEIGSESVEVAGENSSQDPGVNDEFELGTQANSPMMEDDIMESEFAETTSQLGMENPQQDEHSIPECEADWTGVPLNKFPVKEDRILEDWYDHSVDLEDQIRRSFVNSVFPEDSPVQKFLPEGAVDRIITRRSIINELWFDGGVTASDEDRELTTAENDLVEYILTSAKKIFTISLMSGLANVQLKNAMVHFKENRVLDGQLPFDIPLNDTPHSDFFFPDRPWTRLRKEDFMTEQWKLLAPVFPKVFVTLVLKQNHIFPFTFVNQERKEGTFGAVYQVTIHEAHQEEPVRKVSYTLNVHCIPNKPFWFRILTAFRQMATLPTSLSKNSRPRARRATRRTKSGKLKPRPWKRRAASSTHMWFKPWPPYQKKRGTISCFHGQMGEAFGISTKKTRNPILDRASSWTSFNKWLDWSTQSVPFTTSKIKGHIVMAT